MAPNWFSNPTHHPAVAPFKAALVHDGIPFTSFAVDAVAGEHRRLADLGAQFHAPGSSTTRAAT
jgi:hypothetical protein